MCKSIHFTVSIPSVYSEKNLIMKSKILYILRDFSVEATLHDKP